MAACLAAKEFLMRAYFHAALTAALLAGSGAAASPPERTDLALTLYGNGVALVRDQRRLSLERGSNTLTVLGVGRGLIADSLWLQGPEGVETRRHQLNFDLADQQALLLAHVGKSVALVREEPQTGLETETEATLVALSDDGFPVWRIGDRLEMGGADSPWRPRYPQGTLALEPALEVELHASRSGTYSVDLMYLSEGMSWQASHSGRLDRQTGRLDLATAAALDNRSETDFLQAQVTLVAAQPHRERDPRPPMPLRSDAAEMSRADGPAFQAAGDLQRYTVPQTLNLLARTSQTVQLFEHRGVPIALDHRLLGQGDQPLRISEPIQAEVWLALTNQAPSLGRPLPGGLLRLYERDDQGRPLWLGEARLPPLAVGQEWEGAVARAFDVTLRRRQTDFRDLREQGRELEWELEILNAKPEEVTVTLEEAFYGEWRILQASEKYRVHDRRARWQLTVPAGERRTLSYRVAVR
jgi:hypothetical protein